MTRNPSYVGVRRDVAEVVPKGWCTLLDVGCAEGAFGEAIRTEPDQHVLGIELDPAYASRARTRLAEVREGDALKVLERLTDEGRSFDVVVCADILEHLVDPWSALRAIRALCPKGHLVVSAPNIAHFSTIVALITKRRWIYVNRGLLDRTHLRFFGNEDWLQMFREAGFECIHRVTSHRLIESPHRLNRWAAPLLRRIPVVRAYSAYQFIYLLK